MLPRLSALQAGRHTVTEQQYDYGRDRGRYDSGQWSDPASQAPSAPQAAPAPQPRPAPQPLAASQAQGLRRPQLVELFKPFKTGIFLGFGFMVAALIVSAVVLGVMMLLGIGLVGASSGIEVGG
jgi:hypothetical protein